MRTHNRLFPDKKMTLKKAPALMLVLVLLFNIISVSSGAGYVLGDADRSGEITVDDARAVLRVAVKLDSADSKKLELSDFNQDGSVTVDDARAVLRVAVKLDSPAATTVFFPDETLIPSEEISTEDYFSEDEIPADKNLEIFSTAIPEPPVINAAPHTFTFVTYGYGHGVGLTQWGAAIMADAGFTYTEILSYYYSGAVMCTDNSFPETTMYCGKEINTKELVARITAQEIGGITNNLQALKAQAVAIFTLLEKNKFSVSAAYTVGYAKASIDYCSANAVRAANETAGQYLCTSQNTPANTVYSASCAGRTLSSKEAGWGGNFPVSVESPFEAATKDFIQIYTFTEAEIKEKILAYDESILLPQNPAEWIQIVEHNASLDENRGYVTDVLVGDIMLSGERKLSYALNLGLRSGCYTVTYTGEPAETGTGEQ